MTFESQDELISAYLDDELSVDERRHVDRLLVESVELRQLHDELLALRGSLAQLPRHRLSEELAARVLRRAEQSLLGELPAAADAGPAAAALSAGAGQTPGEDRHVRPAQSDEQAWRRPRWRELGWRAVVWPALVLAAALLMMINKPGGEPDAKQREIARVDPQPVPRGGRASIGAAPDDTQDQFASDSQTGGDQPAGDHDGLAGRKRYESAERSKWAVKRDDGQRDRDGLAAPGDPRGAAEQAGAEAKAAAGAEQLAKQKTAVAEHFDAATVAPVEPRSGEANAGLAGQADAGGPSGASQLKAGNLASNGQHAAQDGSLQYNALTDTGATIIVEVQLTPAAVRNHAFEQLLARHDLVLAALPENASLAENEAVAPEGYSLRREFGKPFEAPKLEQAQSVTGQSAPLKPAAPAGARARAEALPGDGPAPASARFDKDRATGGDIAEMQVVMVDATNEQFVATLQDLESHPGQFAAVQLGRALGLNQNGSRAAAEQSAAGTSNSPEPLGLGQGGGRGSALAGEPADAEPATTRQLSPGGKRGGQEPSEKKSRGTLGDSQSGDSQGEPGKGIGAVRAGQLQRPIAGSSTEAAEDSAASDKEAGASDKKRHRRKPATADEAGAANAPGAAGVQGRQPSRPAAKSGNRDSKGRRSVGAADAADQRDQDKLLDEQNKVPAAVEYRDGQPARATLRLSPARSGGGQSAAGPAPVPTVNATATPAAAGYGAAGVAAAAAVEADAAGPGASAPQSSSAPVGPRVKMIFRLHAPVAAPAAEAAPVERGD